MAEEELQEIINRLQAALKKTAQTRLTHRDIALIEDIIFLVAGLIRKIQNDNDLDLLRAQQRHGERQADLAQLNERLDRLAQVRHRGLD